jgi:hypothetical protein
MVRYSNQPICDSTKYKFPPQIHDPGDKNTIVIELHVNTTKHPITIVLDADVPKHHLHICKINKEGSISLYAKSPIIKIDGKYYNVYCFDSRSKHLTFCDEEKIWNIV